MIRKIILPVLLLQFLTLTLSYGQNQFGADDPLISPLPDVLVSKNGTSIDDPVKWRELRRPELLDLFGAEVYGFVPSAKLDIEHALKLYDRNALGGSAVQKEVDVSVCNGEDTLVFTILIYLPRDVSAPVPLVLGLNFYGNHTIHPDNHISITKSWVRNSDEYGIVENMATEESRGVRSHRWPVEMILSRGYGLATIYYGDIDPDFHDGFENGIHRIFPGQAADRDSSDWGSISAWAWGLSRAMDYLETDPDIDQDRVAVFGHSRLGKTSLWAGAQDERFSLVISNNSGCGGAALSRRAFGERVSRINSSFPHWFASGFHKYNDNESELPVDQHMLMSLIAPRPLYVASAEEDLWADPVGEYLSLYHASSVYGLFGEKPFESDQLPAVNQPFWSGSLGYHMRSGKHDVTRYDWNQYLDFADQQHAAGQTDHFKNPVTEDWIRDQLTESSPRLILTPELEILVKGKLSSGDPVTVKGFELMKRSAESILELDLLTYSKTGRRLLGVSREAIRRMSTLALVYRMERDERFLKRLEKEISAVCSFQDWNPSHFLDVAEMAAGLSLSLDWTGEWLSPEISKMARKALIDKALKPGSPAEIQGSWVDSKNNWNTVCHGGLSMAALLVFEDNPELAASILARAVEKIPLALEPYGPDGIYPEGPSYWFYATTYLAAVLSSFETALGTDFGFTEVTGVKESAVFSQVLAGPSGLYFDYFDAGLGGCYGHRHFGMLAWFAARSNSGFNWKAYTDLLSTDENDQTYFPRDRYLSMHFLNIASLNRQNAAEFVYPEVWSGRGDEPICIFRDADNQKDAFFLAAKGGRAADNHGNMDAGSFILELDGIRWAVDPGNQGYNALEQIMGGELWNRTQESGRWDLLTKNNYGHSTLTINGRKHLADARVPMTEMDQRSESPTVSFDMTSLFDGTMDQAIRSFTRISDTRLRVSDDLVFAEGARTITWQLITRAEAEVSDGSVTLNEGQENLHLQVLGDVPYTVNVVSLSPPPLSYDKDIPGLKRIEINFSRSDFSGAMGLVRVDLTNEGETLE